MASLTNVEQLLLGADIPGNVLKDFFKNLLNCDSYRLNDWPVHQLALVTLLISHQLSSVKETPIVNNLAA